MSQMSRSPRAFSDPDLSPEEQELLNEVRAIIIADRVAGRPLLLEGTKSVHRFAERMIAAVPQTAPLAELTGPFYDTPGLTRWLNVTRQAIDNRVRNKRLLACKTADGKWVYPSWQFDENGHVLDGVRDAAIPLFDIGFDGWAVAKWFSAPNPDLDDDTAANRLARGDSTEDVVRLARRDAQRLEH